MIWFEKTSLVTDFEFSDIPSKEISVRSAITALSVSHGQGVMKCNCKRKCGGKCKCLAANQTMGVIRTNIVKISNVVNK